jgi:hypothetical protein
LGFEIPIPTNTQPMEVSSPKENLYAVNNAKMLVVTLWRRAHPFIMVLASDRRHTTNETDRERILHEGTNWSMG